MTAALLTLEGTLPPAENPPRYSAAANAKGESGVLDTFRNMFAPFAEGSSSRELEDAEFLAGAFNSGLDDAARYGWEPWA